MNETMKSNLYLMEILKRFYEIGIPKVTSKEEERFKCRLFSIVDLLSFTLPDRFNLLQDFLGDSKLRAFLTFLYNEECDHLRTNYLILGYGSFIGSPKEVFKSVIHLTDEHEDYKILALRGLSKRLTIHNQIGYEKYFYDIRDEFLFYSITSLGLTFEECFIYYDKSSDSWLKELKNEKLKYEILEYLHSLYNDSNKKSLTILLILKLLSCEVHPVNCKDVAYVKNKNLFINEDLYSINNHEVLMHEACHLLCSYEDRYDDFLRAFLPYLKHSDIALAWASVKEKCINQFIRNYCNIKAIPRTINNARGYDTLSITTSVLLTLKQKMNSVNEMTIWK